MNTQKKSPADLADAAAEAIRELNHVTHSGAGYVWPSEVDAVIANLARTATQIRQALDQARQFLYHMHKEGRLGHDQSSSAGVTGEIARRLGLGPTRTGADIEEEIARLGLRMDHAAAFASDLTLHLEQAREISAHLTGTP